MKILHICSTYIDRPFYKVMFSSLGKLGFENVVYVPRWSNKRVEDNVYIVGKRFSKLSKLLYWGEQNYILKDIESRINLDEIDCVHVHRILYGGYAALKIHEKYGIPYIIAIRNSDIYGFGRNLSIFRKHSNEIMEHAQKVIFLSHAYRDRILEKYVAKGKKDVIKVKTTVVTNGINQFFLDNILQANSHRLPIEKKINLVSVAEIDKNKNVMTLTKACELLIGEGYQVNLRLLGRVVDKKIFQKASNYSFVDYLGVKPKEALIDILRSSDVFAMPSIHESFGLVYAEAMTQGLPVIYTRGQGFDGQYEEGEVGFSVDCFNALEIADRIVDILQDYRNISNRCIMNSKRYSWDIIANEYKDIYDSCLLNSRY